MTNDVKQMTNDYIAYPPIRKNDEKYYNIHIISNLISISAYFLPKNVSKRALFSAKRVNN